MLKLDVQPINLSEANCIEDAIISSVSYFGREYAPMFEDRWSFKFDQNNPDKNVGECISPPISSEMINLSYYSGNILLSRYSGIVCEAREYDTAQAVLESIALEIKDGRPVVIDIDGYWNPWDPVYQKKHFYYHSCLVVGVDFKENILICVDPILGMRKDAIMPIEHFCIGTDKKILVFSISNDYDEIDWKSSLSKALENFKKESVYQSIKNLAVVVEQKLDIENEMRGYENNIWESPILFNLYGVEKGRKAFAQYLNYICRHFNVDELLPVIDDLQVISSKWSLVRALIVKAVYSKVADKKRLADYLNEIAEYENRTYLKMARLLEAHNATVTKINDARLKTEHVSYKDIITLDLRDCFNNVGCGQSLSRECPADFNGNARYFLCNHIKNELKIGEMIFNTSKMGTETKDNVSCNNQLLQIPSGIYRSIMILGCSIYWNFTETLTVYFTDDTSEEIRVEFKSWDSQPHGKDIIAWSGQGIMIQDGERQKIGRENSLFAMEYMVSDQKSIRSMRFPDNPFAFIFAVSLSR